MAIEKENLSKIKHLYEVYYDGITFHKTKRKVAYSNSEYFYMISEKHDKRLFNIRVSRVHSDLTDEQISTITHGSHVWVLNEPVLDELTLKTRQIDVEIEKLETRIYSCNSEIRRAISERDNKILALQRLKDKRKELQKDD